MRIAIGRYQLRIGLEGRREATAAPGRSDRDLQDHEIAALREAEYGHREHARASRSLISGNR